MKTPFIAVAVPLALALVGCAAGPDPVGDTAAAITVTSAGPLTLTLSSSAPPVQGVDDVYTLTIANTTAAALPSIVAEASFFDANIRALPAGCVKAGGRTALIVCTFPTLAAGASLLLPFNINPQSAGAVRYEADASSAGQDLNILLADDTVGPGATDLQITGSSNQGSPPVNSGFIYTFQVKNNGPFATTGGVEFTDVLPTGITFASVTTSVGSCTGGATVTCALGDLAVGAQATIALSVFAPSAAGTVVNAASAALAPTQTDRQPSNNSVGVTVTAK